MSPLLDHQSGRQSAFCAACECRFPRDELRFRDGHLVCVRCREAQLRQQPMHETFRDSGRLPATAPGIGASRDDDPRPGRSRWVRRLLILACCSAFATLDPVLAFGALLVLGTCEVLLSVIG